MIKGMETFFGCWAEGIELIQWKKTYLGRSKVSAVLSLLKSLQSQTKHGVFEP